MDWYEELALAHLTKEGYRFVSPQYSIADGQGGERSCSDFVALNFVESKVTIVEVSANSNPTALRQRVLNRDHKWVKQLRTQLLSKGVITESWQFEVLLYIRQEAARLFERADVLNSSATPVRIQTLESTDWPWNWTRD